MHDAPPYDPERDRQRLVELLVYTGAFRYSPDAPFRLASGATSEYYFDLRLLNGDPEGINTVARILYNHIGNIDGIRSVGGLESGSISVATAVSQMSYLEHRKNRSNPLVTSFFVRKSAKAHGARRMIEGRAESPLVIIDDVITSGMSALKAVREVQDAGHECRSIMSIIFRGTDAQRRDIIKKAPLWSIFGRDELLDKCMAASDARKDP